MITNPLFGPALVQVTAQVAALEGPIPFLAQAEPPYRKSILLQFLSDQGVPPTTLLYRGIRQGGLPAVLESGTDWPDQPGIYAYDAFDLGFIAPRMDVDPFALDFLLLYDKAAFQPPARRGDDDYWHPKDRDQLKKSLVLVIDLKTGEIIRT